MPHRSLPPIWSELSAFYAPLSNSLWFFVSSSSSSLIRCIYRTASNVKWKYVFVFIRSPFFLFIWMLWTIILKQKKKKKKKWTISNSKMFEKIIRIKVKIWNLDLSEFFLPPPTSTGNATQRKKVKNAHSTTVLFDNGPLDTYQ